MAAAQSNQPATEQTSVAAGLLEGSQADIEEAFSLFDIDGDGLISLQELLSVIESIGKECSVDDAKEIILMVDKNGDGFVNYEDFRDALKEKILTGINEEDLQEAFSVFDTNNSGFINAIEVKDGFRTLGEALTDEEAEEIVTDLDKNDDGLIDFQEFKKHYMSVHKKEQEEE